ncbi:MAG: hypothetical protein C4555_01210 [Dehalococcoidia bacterium]|nr:MAG: hypothetical protein C4555_01210 [Dehalococcoidia bacterium]
MARKGKQYVFSARTTEEGLKKLGELRQERRMGWDELVIDAIAAHYNLDRAMMPLPRKEKPVKEAQPAEQQPAEEIPREQPTATEQERPTEGKQTAKKRKKGGKKASKPAPSEAA